MELDKDKNLKKNKEENNEFDDILENIIEMNIDKELKRRNSFSGQNILNKKKQSKNIQIINKTKEKDIEKDKEKDKENENEQPNPISLLMENGANELKKEESNKNSEMVSNSSNIDFIFQNSIFKKKNSLEKGSNLSSSSKGRSRNFVLKSEICKINKKENIEIIKEKNYNFTDFNLTKKNIKKEKQNENSLYNYFLDKNSKEKVKDSKNDIFSITYKDIEKEYIEQNNEEIEENFDGEDDIINNFYLKSDLFDKKYLNKEIINDNKDKIKVNNNINVNNINNNNNKITNNKSNINVYTNNQIKVNNNQEIYNNNNYINNKNKENNINNTTNTKINEQNKIQYIKQNCYYNTNLNNIQKTYINFYPQYFNYTMKPNIYYNINPYIYQYNMPVLPYQNINTKNKQFTNYSPLYNSAYNKYQNNNVKIDFKDDKDLSKNASFLIKTQMGCRILVEKIKNNEEFANKLLFPDIKNNLEELSQDSFGSYFIQNLLDILNLDNINIFLSSIQDSLFNISITENGSRVIQKLLDKISNSSLLINKFIFILSNKDIRLLFKSPYANHIIQKYLTIFKDVEYTNFIYNSIYNNFLDITKTKHGVCVIQKALSEGNISQRKKILELIIYNIKSIMKDCYANFLIQYIIIISDKFDDNEIFPIIEEIEKNIVEYCKNKYSASVIEKCFDEGKEKVNEHFLNYLLDYHSEEIIDIIFNSYGIYIIKKALNMKNSILKEKIKNIVYKNINEIKKANNGAKIIDTLNIIL